MGVSIAQQENDGGVRMDDVCWVVHTLLESAVEVGKGFCRGGKAHVLAEVVAAARAVVAGVAHDAGLDRDTLADDQATDARTDGSHDASRLMTEDEWCLERKVSVAAVDIVVH